MNFQPDYRMILDVLANRRPTRLPLYEHIIAPQVMEKILNRKFSDLENGDANDLGLFFENYCHFFKSMTYDTVSYEVTIADRLPGHGAILGGKPGPIQSRSDFQAYPWDRLPELYWAEAQKRFAALEEMMPEGMKAVGGVGNGVFEISEDLVGMEYLAYLQADDPELHAELYTRIGDLMYKLWDRFLKQFGNAYAVCRMGDDLGFKSGFLISPATIRKHIMPQYKRITDLIHSHGKPFLWHSCGCVFGVMDEMIELGIDAKHSNEDQIAPFDRWIDLYGQRIGLLGGIDVNLLCLETPEYIKSRVQADALRFRQKANGFALGSGNSIPNYVPVEGYLAMVEAAQAVRKDRSC
ncbi:methylcobalamin:coenzyme M methyltransferase [Anaerohalosphaera lusitana]|uniref:Methylcobalamin:coenzyme M methyltransferase n=1 Tax=Anaerohalosphaera lusitana TaxID=1936003 RepID=A0A1U9NJ49_9BACT|nr:uroporphyrinogen decarboxylase family protein [Anaerohalosphaera lusitana]AQT67610.1 methylcobalamin:coenzyme M methyltransferase [Anaerohalosphaera lusitana]